MVQHTFHDYQYISQKIHFNSAIDLLWNCPFFYLSSPVILFLKWAKLPAYGWGISLPLWYQACLYENTPFSHTHANAVPHQATRLSFSYNAQPA